MHTSEITPLELSRLLQERKPCLLIDVRGADERLIARIEGDTHIPLETILEQAETLPKDQTLIFYCHSGVRSGQVCRLLLSRGFAMVKNLTGGIDRWTVEIDPTLKRY
jgi:rhodanese-related sulfurtransferase